MKMTRFDHYTLWLSQSTIFSKWNVSSQARSKLDRRSIYNPIL